MYQTKYEKTQIRRIWVSAWMVTAVFILSNLPTPLYVYWQQEMGFSNGTLTLVFAVYIAGLLVTLLVAGQLSDRFGRKSVLYPGLTAALLACILFATASSVVALVVARFLSGVAVGVIVSAGMASVMDVGGSERKPLASLAASVTMVLGAGLGPLLAGILAEVMTRPVFPIFMVELVVLASAYLVVGKLPKRRIDSLQQDRWRLRMPNVPSANRLHLALGIAVFAPGITATSFVLSLGPSLLSKLLNVTSPLVAGGTACVMFLAATGVQFMLKKLPVRTIFLISATSTILSMLSMAGAVNTSVVLLLVIAAVLAGVGQGLGQLGGLTLIGLHVPEHRRAESNAVLNIGGYIPAALLPVCAGYVIDYTGLAFGVTTFTAILSLIAGAAVIFVRTQLQMDNFKSIPTK
ncbi:Predicted arabinose efflux permease, MFS family [Gracilibacillus orientalis]|uniref:Predicted arabinose efflux permease, MFS family n=1 Tax=Gracilibacillus orientalis TaxID=334253 RepID=A0A1I4K097_9BACI|nr:MFS transporter [Gracilibacillus orientalis]SFL72220.1 Predicted arabinose efflux permease, MFS family [Gracilibacillus orientalis]